MAEYFMCEWWNIIEAIRKPLCWFNWSIFSMIDRLPEPCWLHSSCRALFHRQFRLFMIHECVVDERRQLEPQWQSHKKFSRLMKRFCSSLVVLPLPLRSKFLMNSKRRRHSEEENWIWQSRKRSAQQTKTKINQTLMESNSCSWMLIENSWLELWLNFSLSAWQSWKTGKFVLAERFFGS